VGFEFEFVREIGTVGSRSWIDRSGPWREPSPTGCSVKACVPLPRTTMAEPQSPTETQPQVAYGVKYTPADADLAFEAPTWTGLAAWNDIRFIRLTWVDISSVIRCKVLTLKYFRTLVSRCPNGVPTTTLTNASLGLVGRTLVDGFSVAGDYLFEVDLTSLRLLSYIPGYAMVFGWLKPINAGPGPQVTDPLCPRTILKNVVGYVVRTSIHCKGVPTFFAGKLSPAN
jgi:hypothetical protein